MSVPFTSEAGLNAGFTNTQYAGSYIGMADSAVLCSHPNERFDFFNESLDLTDYKCFEEDLPIEPPEWDEKWYSPVCRDWFKDQRAAPTQGTLSDLYIYTEGQLGLTQCAPIIQQESQSSDSNFIGALCLDLEAVESNKVFGRTEEEAKSQIVMFNPDQYYTAAVRQSYFLSFDLVLDTERNENLDKTNFYKLLNKQNKKNESSKFLLKI